MGFCFSLFWKKYFLGEIYVTWYSHIYLWQPYHYTYLHLRCKRFIALKNIQLKCTSYGYNIDIYNVRCRKMVYKQLNVREREEIMVYRRMWMSVRAIGEKLGRSHSTISREIHRNGYVDVKKWDIQYSVEVAMKKYRKRKEYAYRHHSVLGYRRKDLWEMYISSWLSPAWFVWRLWIEWGEKVSVNTVYRYSHRVWYVGNLRYKAYGYKKKGEKKKRFGYATHISQRDICVERRARNEDWELDTVIGKDHKSSLLTCTSRRSRYIEIRRLEKTSASEVVKAMVDIAKYQKILTTTSDRGSEFAYFRTLEDMLGIQSYMTSAFAAWEKWSNERNNREIRVYIPKWADIWQWDEEELEAIQARINHMPRWIHNYKTAYEIHYGVDTKLLKWCTSSWN